MLHHAPQMHCATATTPPEFSSNTPTKGERSGRDLAERTIRQGPCYARRHFGGNGLIKILLLIAIGFVVLGLFRAYQRSLNKPSTPERERTVEDMVKCAHCGVNLPRSEAIYSGGEFYCTPEHRQLGKK
jgi:uncharacterized protein